MVELFGVGMEKSSTLAAYGGELNGSSLNLTERWWVERRVVVGDGREGSCGGVELLGEGEDAVGTAWMVSVVEDFDCPNAGCRLFVFLR